ncbi:metallophosphoesterase family protein [Bacillus weihaiensis]|uniref:metallophosphoesterase family protein n=1 Tax=Bacillus weihaiensis TaxID=1547283 RepID=UPI002357856A|nr:DNA repair exonuclease [Bacillus weihaiensis]
MQKLTFIHAADLHLDSPFKGLKHMPHHMFERMKDSTFRAFTRLSTYAITKKVDFVLISGDLYDDEDRSLKAQLKLKREFERLFDAGIDVFIIHGNHDHTSGNWLDLVWPSNVHIFSDKDVERKIFYRNEEATAFIYGKSYPTRSVVENITGQFVKEDNKSVYHIGMLHGSVEGNHDHDVYCPFTIQELLSKQFDYWALGHIHKRQFLHDQYPLIVYPGNIQGRHRKEEGEKGFYHVELTRDETKTIFISTQDILWESTEVVLHVRDTMQDVLKRCESRIRDIRRYDTPVCLTITITGVSSLATSLQSREVVEDLMDALNEQEISEEAFVWVAKIRNEVILPVTQNPTIDAFLKDIQKTAEEVPIFQHVLEPLAKHPMYRKYMEDYTKEDQKALIEQAEKLLQMELLIHSKEGK